MIAEKAASDSLPALLDVQAVARLLNCSPRHVTRLVERGDLPRPIKLGTLIRWNRAAVEEWIANGCKATPMTES
jgi:excisionase family DNA binding protein